MMNHGFPRYEMYLQQLEKEEAGKYMGEKDKLFFGLGGKRWNVAEVSILRRFAEVGLDKIVKGEVVFDGKPPSYEEFISNEMQKATAVNNHLFQSICASLISERGIDHFTAGEVPLDGKWPNFREAPFNLSYNLADCLRADLFSEERWRLKSLADIQLKKSEFEHRFFLLESAFKDDQRRWEDKITQCVKIWRECLGSRVLHDVEYLLAKRDMPGVLEKLRSDYGSIEEDDYEILSRRLSIAYLPSECTFLGFIKQFEEIYDYYPEEKKPNDSTMAYDLIAALERGGFKGLDSSIFFYRSKHSKGGMVYEDAKRFFFRILEHSLDDEKSRLQRTDVNESKQNENHDDDNGDEHSRARGTPVCSYCGKSGHATSICRHLKRDQKQQKKRRRSDSR
jgi:hypothetical protein